jgi:hypothetical protein
LSFTVDLQTALGGYPQPVELLKIPAECLDDEFQRSPPWHRGADQHPMYGVVT